MDDKKRVLLIDDEADFTKLMKWNLEKTGKYEVRMENQGQNAIAVAKEFKPNIILLDIMMPDVDGGEVCFTLENDPATEDIPVVFLTAAIGKGEKGKDGSFIGNHLFIAKPVDIEQLVKTIDENSR